MARVAGKGKEISLLGASAARTVLSGQDITAQSGSMTQTVTGKNILLYEPNVNVHQVLTHALTSVGFAVTSVAKTPTAIANDTWLVAGGPDPLLETRSLRERSTTSACFLLYPNDDMNTDVCAGIAKPFRLAELITALLRIVTRPRDVTVGTHTLQVAERQFDMGGNRTVALTEKEVAILLHLAQAHAAVPRDALLHEVWGYHPDATTHTLETHIYRLRQKIEADPDQPRILITTDDGYRLQT